MRFTKLFEQTPENEGTKDNEGEEDEWADFFEGFEQTSNPVVGALSRRVLHSRLDLIKEHGLDAVTDAIEAVAASHVDVFELGSSDISVMVKEVEEHLRRSFQHGW